MLLHSCAKVMGWLLCPQWVAGDPTLLTHDNMLERLPIGFPKAKSAFAHMMDQLTEVNSLMSIHLLTSCHFTFFQSRYRPHWAGCDGTKPYPQYERPWLYSMYILG